MRAAMLGLLAETPIHPGAGRSMGVVDLPVARESSTHYPVLVGSSLKGALKDKAAGIAPQGLSERFGSQERAGDFLVADARLLLLPVRSLTTAFRWVTCPHLVERYARDLRRAGLTPPPPTPVVNKDEVLATGREEADGGSLFLEERQFTVGGEPDDALVSSFEPLLLHADTRERLKSQTAVLHDDDFAWFVRYGLSLQARNVLDDETKQSKNLWYEETLPPDTVMHALVAARTSDALATVDTLFPDEDPYLQAGGNETVGQGWFAVRVRRNDAGGDS